MKHSALLRAFTTVAAALGLQGLAVAAPDRLDNKVPDAFPDNPGAFAFSLGHEWLDLDGALVSQTTNHSMFKLRYQFNPKVAGSIGYQMHDLAGAEGLLSPLFNQQDSANIWNFDISMNLLNTERIPAGEGTEFTPGSAFTIGVGGDFYDTSAGAVSDSTTLLKAYLMYSTDLTEDMMAHTYFSSGRLSGGGRSGSVNTIGAGLDYELVGGENQLTLMANGVMDIYNFRDPAFNTSRVSRFDLGLRYKASPGLYTSLGWMTVNDSENDASGSGIWAGLNWVDGAEEECLVCDPLLEDKQPAAPPQPAANSGDNSALANSAAPMMDNAPALDYPGEAMPAGLRGTEALITASADQNSSRSTPGKRETPPLELYGSSDSEQNRSLASLEDREQDPASALSRSSSSVGSASSGVTHEQEQADTLHTPVDRGTLDKIHEARSTYESGADTAGDTEPAGQPEAAEEIVMQAVPLPDEIARPETGETPAFEAAQPEESVQTQGPTIAIIEDDVPPGEPETGSSLTEAAQSSTEAEPTANKYTRGSRFDFPSETQDAAPSAAPEEAPIPPASEEPVAPAAVLEMPEAPDSGLHASTAADKQTSTTALSEQPEAGAENSTDVLIAQLPMVETQPEVAAATPTRTPQLAPVPLPTQLQQEAPTAGVMSADGETREQAMPGRPRHVQPGDKMQRPPISEKAKTGLAQLLSLKAEQQPRQPDKERDNEITGWLPLDRERDEEEPAELELLVPTGSNG